VTLRVYQSLWATEKRRAGVPELPIAERFESVKEAGYDGMAIDLGALDLASARACVPEYARTGLAGLLTAFPTSIEGLRPALHLAKDIGAPFVIVVGQVMPVGVRNMPWRRLF
jgi:sugar phosphate isomerase/epimerase